MAAAFSGWVYVVKGLGSSQRPDASTGGNPVLSDGDTGIPRASTASLTGVSQVIPGYLALVDKTMLMYKKDPQSFPTQEPIFKGLVQSDTVTEVLGRRVFPSGQVLHLLSVSSGGTAAAQTTRSLEIGCSTAEAAHEWVTAIEAAATGTPAKIQDGPSPGLQPIGAQVAPIGSGAPRAPGALSDDEDDALDAVTWRLIMLTNGIRIFEGHQTGDEASAGVRFLKAEGIVEAEPDRIFEVIMDMSQTTRSQWDNMTVDAEVLEVVDGFTDICHAVVLPPGKSGKNHQRDIVVRRTWRRNEDGSYMISNFLAENHGTLATNEKLLRSSSTSGWSWDIIPLCGARSSAVAAPNPYYHRSLVRYVIEVQKVAPVLGPLGSLGATLRHRHRNPLAVFKSLAHDGWSRDKDKEKDKDKDRDVSPSRSSGAGSSTPPLQQLALNDLGHLEDFLDGFPFHSMCRIAGLREYFASLPPPLDRSAAFSLDQSLRSQPLVEPSVLVPPSTAGMAAVGGEEFFDALESTVKEEEGIQRQEAARKRWQRLRWFMQFGMLIQSVMEEGKELVAGLSWAVQRELLHNVAPKDMGALAGALAACCNVPAAPVPNNIQGVDHAWRDPGGANFFIRGPTYLDDHAKIAAGEPLLKCIGMDWFTSEARMDNIATRPNTLPQTEAGKSLPFIFVINLQVPGPPFYSCVVYFAADRPIRAQKQSLLYRFYNNPEDAFRNHRFKLIPRIAEGHWMVKRAVGTKACILGKALKCTYKKGENYLEMDCDIGSSSVARNVIGLVISYVTTLVVDLAFLIEAQESEELPEYLLGAFTCVRLDTKKAVPPPPEASDVPQPATPEI